MSTIESKCEHSLFWNVFKIALPSIIVPVFLGVSVMFYILFDKINIRETEFIERQKILLRGLSRKAIFQDTKIFFTNPESIHREEKIAEIKNLLREERLRYDDHIYQLISLSYITKDKKIIISDPEDSGDTFSDIKVLVGNSSVVDSGFLLEDQLITRTSLPVFNNYTHAVTGYLVARSASGNPGGSLTLSLSDFNFRYFLWMLTCIAFFLFHISLLFLLTWIIVKRMTNPLTRLSRATQQIADGELNIKIHIDRNDEIGMVAAHFNEMAERLRKNALIERRFRDLARTSTDWIWEIDKDYRFTYSNPAVKSLIGYSSKEILNKTPFSLSHYEDKDRLNKIISQLSHNKEPVKSIRHRIIRKDNTVCFLDISAVAVYDGQGTIVGFRGIGRDVTQQYYTEQERERLNKELIETNREIEQFVYSVSHDLQRPLLSMQSMIKLIEDEPLCTENPLVGSFLIRFQKSITSMGDMIEGLVEISKVGRVDMERDYVDVNELVQAIIDEIKLRLDTQNIVITISDSLPGVWCNRKRLTQIFSNLLDNAVKFMPKGRKGGIVIKGAKKDSALHYSVSDNGPGIDTKYHENIFQMFERLHGDSIAGNGMGLYFIKKIIESYNGKIWVESEPGRGAAFHFVLPVSENLSHSVRCNRKTPIPERAEV